MGHCKPRVTQKTTEDGKERLSQFDLEIDNTKVKVSIKELDTGNIQAKFQACIPFLLMIFCLSKKLKTKASTDG